MFGQNQQPPARRAAIASAFAGVVIACSLLAVLSQGTREAADLLEMERPKGKSTTPLRTTSLVEMQKRTGLLSSCTWFALISDILLENTYSTVWNGDHVLNGGNKEWAEEDAALHAFNMVIAISNLENLSPLTML